MNQNIKWGIIGLGKIALKFANAFKYLNNAQLVGISSKNNTKLQNFKEKYKIKQNNCFNSYEKLIKSDEIDIIYIALPNSLHHEWIIKCIEKGKNVLVEKPATVNLSQINEIKKKLDDNNVLFAEALMYVYNPQILKVIELIKKDKIGKLISMESNFGKDILTKKNFFGFNKRKKLNKESRIYNKELGGGAILDLGCYPVSFSTLISSLISEINYDKIKVINKKNEIGSTGVDLDSYAELKFDNNFTSKIGASFTKNLGRKTIIMGDNGKMIIENTWHADPAIINIIGENNEKYEINSSENIFSYEINLLSKCIVEGKKIPDFPGLSIDESLGNMKILEKWLN